MTIDEDIKNIADLLMYSEHNDSDFITIIYDESDPARPPSAPFFKHSQSIKEMQKRKLLEITNIDHNRTPIGEFDVRLREFPFYEVKCSLKHLKFYMTKNNLLYRWEGYTFNLFFKNGPSQPITFELNRKNGEIKGHDLIIYHTFKVLTQHWESVGDKEPIFIDKISEILQNKGFNSDRTTRERISDLVGGVKTKIRRRQLDKNIKIWFDKSLDGYFISIIQT